jgi:hypothetical protein
MDAGSVIAAIQGSPEYAARATAGAAPGVGGGGTDLSSIYQQYLGRGVDPSGASTFAGQSADSVINAILNSPEYASRAGAMGAAGGLPPGAATALASMDVAPAWLPPTQYAQYGFNAQGKKEKEGLGSLQPNLPEGIPKPPPGFTYASTNNVGGNESTSSSIQHVFSDAKGGTLYTDANGTPTGYVPPQEWYAQQYAAHPDAVRSGYRNQQYLAAGPLDATVNINGQKVDVIPGNQFLVDPGKKQLVTDKSGNYVQLYTPPEGNSGFENIMNQLINTGIMVGSTAIGGPIGAAGAAGLLTTMHDGSTSDILRNAALAGGTAFIGGQIFPTDAVPIDQITGSEFTSPAFQLTPEGAIAANNALSAIPTAIESGISTLSSNVPTEPLTAPTEAPPTVNPDITQILQQTYPDANIAAPVAQAPLTAAEIQAANLPMDVALQPGTISAATNNIGYLPQNAPPDQLLQAARGNINSNVTEWWKVTGIPTVDAAIKNAIYGAGMGALTSGIGGGSVGKGAMYGGIAGGITGAGTEYLGSKYFPQGFNPSGNQIADAGIRNALAGAANSAIATKLAGGNAGKAALIGGGISGVLGAGMQSIKPGIVSLTDATPSPTIGGDMSQEIANMELNKEYERAYGLTRSTNYEVADYVSRLRESGMPMDTLKTDMIDSGMDPRAVEVATRPIADINSYLTENTIDGPSKNPDGSFNETMNRARVLEMTVGTEIGQAGEAGINMPLYTDTPLNQQYINQDLTEGVPVTDTDLTDALQSIIPFAGFAVNPPGKNQAPSGGGGGGGSGGNPKKPLKVPKRAGSNRNFDNYLLKHIVNAGNVYTPEATGYQSVGYKEGGEVKHYDIGGSISNGLTNLFKPIEQNVIQPVGQAAPFLKTVLPYAAMAAAPFLGPTAAAGIGALGSGFGTTPGAGFNMKRALMGGIASYGLSNIGSGLAEAGMPVQAPVSMGSIEEPLVNGTMQYTPQNPATTGGFWDQITNKAENMKQGASNLLKGGDSFTNAANAFGTKAGMGSAGMAIMGGTGVLGVDEADAQNQAVAGTNSSAAQQRAIIADKRAQAKTNAQNAVAANPFHFAMGGMMPNPPDDQTGMPNQTPMQNFEHGGIPGYAMGGMPRFLSGGGDGMSDSIHANIDGSQEARLADGEFVIPADVVSHLGNGSSKAGAKQLYSMMDRVRQARTGRKSQGREINPNKLMPV